ncbi:phage baseplate assembly protein V [Wukongibacter baidiensis]|uniref:phage baseplate assembly protein V n=1 Tax=Wukongibacter baidiensis TaxID=1723361 RepID=UPI003D7F6801
MANHKQIHFYVQEEELRISSLKQCEIKSEINEHGTLEIGAIIYEEDIEKYSHKITSLDPIKVVLTEDETSTTLFQGLVYKMEIEVIGLVAYLTLKGISYSYLLDIESKERSFQDTSITYGDLVKSVLSDYSKTAFKFSDMKVEGSKVNRPYIQYSETDWKFLKRVMSKLGMGLVSPIELMGLKIWLDAPNEVDLGDITEFVQQYKVSRDFKQYKLMEENYKSDVIEIDYTAFSIKSSNIMFTGTKVIFNHIKLYVKDVKIVLENADIHFYYTLVPRKGLYVPTFKPITLKGVSLFGKVIDVKDHVVQVHFDIDNEQSKKTAYWFPFATVSASKNNVGWYFMPEIGDGVRVYFEDGEEENGVATEAIPIDPSDIDPNIRYISTIHGKEIKVAPNGIYITSKGEELYIRLDDDKGISICSDTNINIIAKEAINILSDTKIEMAAEGIHLVSGVNGETTIDLADDVLIDANHVKVNGK